MKLYRYLLPLLLMSFSATDCLAQFITDKKTNEPREMLGSNISGPECKPGQDDFDEEVRVCKGREGYSLEIKGDENRPQISLLSPEGTRDKIPYWDLTDKGYQSIQSSVLWIIVNEPKKTVSVTFRLKVEPRQDYAQWGFYEIIARVSPGPVCVVGSVPASPSSAGESVAIASSPDRYPCLGLEELQKRDWFLTARRLAAEGNIAEAKSALEHLAKPSERFIIYREISIAQFKGGDREGAHATLMTARNEALKKPAGDTLRATLGEVVSGLAAAGFDDEAKADISRFLRSEQLQMYLTIAYVQGERNDLDAAKKTYREAIDAEIKNTPQPTRDWNLARIAQSQARWGLYEEMKRTASMIQDAAARKSAEAPTNKQ